MVRVKGTDACKGCRWGGEFSEGCTYMLLNNKSRLIEDGKRYDPAYCAKYEEGSKDHGEIWKRSIKKLYERVI